jgi:importin subunit alpha-1
MDKDAKGAGGVNDYAVYIEEAGGMVSLRAELESWRTVRLTLCLVQVAIHNLQHHENLDIYKKCFYIMDKYFPEG